jgi:transposase
MKLMRVGVDLAKNVFQVHGVDRNEKPVWRRRLSRKKWLNMCVLPAAVRDSGVVKRDDVR